MKISLVITLALAWKLIATEEKLNMIRSMIIYDKDTAYLVKMLDNSQSSICTMEYLPTNKEKVRDWFHMFVYWLQVTQYGISLVVADIHNADRVTLPFDLMFSN